MSIREISLTKGKIAIIDESDFELVSQYKWYANHKRQVWYAEREPSKRHPIRSMHRLVMNAQKGQIVDHINGDGLDNRKANLRFVNNSQNAINFNRVNRTSKYGHGVGFRPQSNTFYARISREGKILYLGAFKTAEEARAARKEAELKYYGEYVRKSPSSSHDDIIKDENE